MHEAQQVPALTAFSAFSSCPERGDGLWSIWEAGGHPAPQTASRKADLGRLADNGTCEGFMVFRGALTVRPGGRESKRDPSLFWAQLFPFRHPSLFLFHVGKCEPSPFYQDFPGGRLHQCDMIYTSFQRPMFTRCKLSPSSGSGPRAGAGLTKLVLITSVIQPNKGSTARPGGGHRSGLGTELHGDVKLGWKTCQTPWTRPAGGKWNRP